MSFPKIYTVNGPSTTQSSTLPSWLAVKSRPKRNSNGIKKRTKTQHQIGQLELIQDFTFPESSIKIKTTPDGLHALGTGAYKPMIKCWDLEGLTTKFERVTESENVDFVILSTDWTKSLHLQRDRSLQLHTQGGLHHTIRLPTYGRSLAYHSPSADALVAATGTEVFRFNLEEGRYMTPLQVARGWGNGMEDEVEGVNVVEVNPRHGLWSFGLDGAGVIEFWDPRSRSALTRLSLPASTLLPMGNGSGGIDGSTSIPAPKLGITALSSHPSDGLSLAVGTTTGHTLLYDLRSPTPFAIKDQGYGEPIRVVDWLRGGGAQEDNGRVVSADSKVIKVWDKMEPSTNHLSLHPPATLTHLHAVPNSGLIFVACDSAQLSSYYIPELGPAPKWASFLDSVTEEMAEDLSGLGKSAYTDFKFVDKNELDTLGLTHLIGTPALKPYMHGYFLSLKLYTTARLIANPQSYEQYRSKVINEKLAAKAESRIRAKREQPKVNKALAERLQRAAEREEVLAKKKAAKKLAAANASSGVEVEEDREDVEGDGDEPVEVTEAQARKTAREGLLEDPRFKDLWENPDFEVDEESREFALLNPATANNNAQARLKTAVEEEEEDSDKFSSDLEEDESDDEDDDKEGSDAGSVSDDSEDGDLYDPRVHPTSRKPVLPPSYQPKSRPRMVIGSSAEGSSKPTTFGQRLHKTSSASTSQISKNGKSSAKAGEDGILAMRRGLDGGMEMSFIPQKSNSRKDRDDYDENGNERDEYNGGGSVSGRRGKEKGLERFGAGMEKGKVPDSGEGLKGDDRMGRTQRRHGVRSGSKNAFRKR